MISLLEHPTLQDILQARERLRPRNPIPGRRRVLQRPRRVVVERPKPNPPQPRVIARPRRHNRHPRPGLTRDQITITCADGMIQEARICLTKDLAPRRCGDDGLRDCRMKDAQMEAVR